MTKTKIVNLNEEVELWAEKFYKKFNQKDLESSMSMRLPFCQLKMVLDTTNFFIESDDPQFSNPLSQSSENIAQAKWQRKNVLFKTSYSNTTNNQMQYAISAQRSTRSVCHVALSNGFVMSGQTGLKVALPSGLAELNAGMTQEVSMGGSREQEVEQELTWNVDTTVHVPPKKTVTVELVIKEFEYSSSFSVTTRFRGSIRIALYKDDIKICTIRANDLRDVFKESLGFKRVPEADYLEFTSDGHCHTVCGVEQKIQIDEKDIA